MSEILRREFTADFQVRSGGDGRTVCGLAVPFNAFTPIVEWGESYDEQFAPGSFARTIAERGSKVKFVYQHHADKPIGRATLLREDPAGLYAEFRVSRTQLGDEVLELLKDGALDAFSIGFKPVRDTTTMNAGGKRVTRTEVGLREVSAVTFPAYEGALVSGIRSLSHDDLSQASQAFILLREGKQLSAANVAVLKHVLDLVAAADTAVDDAQPILATLLGVPNPDVAQDASMDNSGMQSGQDSPSDDSDGGADGRSVIEIISVRAWDAGEAVKRIPADAPAGDLKKMFAWTPGGDFTKSQCKFPFHDVSADGTVGAPNLDACTAGIAALNGAHGGTTLSDADKEAVYAKLAAPLKAAGTTPPPLRSAGMSYDLAVRRARLLGITLAA